LIEGTDMYSTPTLATRFARNTRVLRGDAPQSDDQMRGVATSVFAEGKHATHAAAGSVPGEVAQQKLGHASLAITSTYKASESNAGVRTLQRF
jgi:hypothetical protein